jgi:predicted membrane protein DUF2207
MRIDPNLLLELAIGGMGIGGWFALFGIFLLLTRPREVQPMPPTQELGGPESPALVSLLANRWEVTEDAAESTLLDLAARRYLELRQPGNDPMQTTIHVRSTDTSGLAPYERRVLDRVAGLAKGGVVPLPALTFRDQAEAKSWAKRLRAEVVAEARAKGLSQRRFSKLVVSALTVAAAVAGVLVLVAMAHHGLTTANAWRTSKGDKDPTFGAALLTFVGLAALGAANRGERDTAAGRAVAARWLGLKAYLRGDESFQELPPSAVAVWERYLSYGDAVGATRVCSAVIDLGMGNRRRVWSSFGGTWHRVRVRYPKLWPHHGQTPVPLILKAVGVAAVGFLILRYRNVPHEVSPGGYVGSVDLVVYAVGLTLLLGGAYRLVRTIVDTAAPVTLTGEVLWLEVWKSTSGGEDSPARPWLYYLAVDDGHDDRTVAWGLPATMHGQCQVGDVVEMTARRWTRRVVRVRLVEPGSARRLAAADAAYPRTDDTEKLIAAAMGVPAERGPGGVAQTLQSARVSAGQLLSAEEVSRGLGQPVTPQDPAMPAGAPMSMQAYRTAGGRALYVTVTAGMIGSLAFRSRRRGQPLPGLGDEAFAGDRWAAARRGDHVVMLQLHADAGAVDPRNVYWLLSLAVGRLPA